MFHLMMALLFSYKRRTSLNIYVSTLMLVTVALYVKNLALIGDGYYDSALESLYSSSIDLFICRSMPSFLSKHVALDGSTGGVRRCCISRS